MWAELKQREPRPGIPGDEQTHLPMGWAVHQHPLHLAIDPGKVIMSCTQFQGQDSGALREATLPHPWPELCLCLM